MTDAPTTQSERDIDDELREPDAIMFIGGEKHGTTMADFGQGEVHSTDEIYRRHKITLVAGPATISKDFLVYRRKAWEGIQA
jgi:hypothetical protein